MRHEPAVQRIRYKVSIFALACVLSLIGRCSTVVPAAAAR